MTYLITAAEVVSLAFNDKNFLTGKILNTHLTIAHEGFLRPALGDDFYLHLIEGANTEADTNLVNNYLKAPLAMYVRYIILPDIIAHVSNTGIQVIQPQGSITASDRQAGLLREQAKENAEILMDFATRFIQQNAELFPLYSFSETVKATTRILGGVIFGGGMSRRKTSAPSIASTTTVIQSGFSETIVKQILDFRTKVGYANGALLMCNENNGIYEYFSTSEAADDGIVTIAPGGSLVGRWVMIKELQMVNL